MIENEAERIVYCDECNYEFLLNAVNIEQDVVELNNVPVHLVYFVCPKCDKIYRVSIQDKLYYELKRDLEKAEKRWRRNYGRMNKAVAENLHAMIVKKHNRLKEYVKEVNKRFPGTFVFETCKGKPKKRIIKYLP